MSGLRITYSLADQSFSQTKSIGIFNMSLALARHLQGRAEVERLHLLSNSGLEGLTPPAANTTTTVHDRAIGGRLGRVIWDQWELYSAARATGNDWLFLPKGFASFLRRPPMRLAACVADTIHDYYRSHYPNAVSGLEDRYFDLSLKATLRHAKLIFTISEFTRAEVLRVGKKLGLNPPRVIHAGIGFEDPGPPPSGARSGVMVLAGRFPHKQTRRAIELLHHWQRESGFDEAVHWVGSLPEGAALPDCPNWRTHSRLSESEYRSLMAECRALVFTSEYEGFGMPPVEAALAGAVPVFSAIPATLEVMGESGLSFRNDDANSFCRAMTQALQIGPEHVQRWKSELLSRHNWRRVGDRIIAGLRQAMTS